ncbi:MAG TPA: hypothetical protein VGO47_12190, partial [Chlamydiales bacterium]|nr:hypothetical protein [Chlamydiales bacterium]
LASSLNLCNQKWFLQRLRLIRCAILNQLMWLGHQGFSQGDPVLSHLNPEMLGDGTFSCLSFEVTHLGLGPIFRELTVIHNAPHKVICKRGCGGFVVPGAQLTAQNAMALGQ